MADNILQPDPLSQYEDVGRAIHSENAQNVSNEFTRSFPLLIKQYRPDLATGRSWSDLQALRNDPAISADMAAKNAYRNAQVLQGAGIPINRGTLTLSHIVGPGALTQMMAAPDKQIGDMADPLGYGSIFNANPQLQGYTVNDFIAAKNKPAPPPVNNVLQPR